jgi:hypothetical protein
MNLMANEQILVDSGALKLTTHRVRYSSTASSQGVIKSIMLEELASCTLIQTSNPALLVIAAICFLAALFLRNGGAILFGVVVAGVLVAIYFFSQKQTLMLASAGTTINYSITGMKQTEIENFIDRVEAAKNDRFLIGK